MEKQRQPLEPSLYMKIRVKPGEQCQACNQQDSYYVYARNWHGHPSSKFGNSAELKPVRGTVKNNRPL